MAVVVNRTEIAITLPVVGVVLRPGVPAKVEKWHIVSRHRTVAGLIRAGAVVVRGEGGETDNAATIRALRAEYRAATGENADGRWGEDRLCAEIEGAKA